MMEAIATAVSAIIAALALLGWYLDWRTKQLRREDVLAWANQSITALQSVVLVCVLDETRHPEGYLQSKVSDLIFETSALTERGRLFFRNVIKDNFGSEKHTAYRGYHPRILDHLVIGHQIACAWKNADEVTRRKMAIVAEDNAKQFVSLVRDEVGRDKTASGGAAIEGYGVQLPSLMEQVDDSPANKRDWL